MTAFITYQDKNEIIYTVEITDKKFVDVKHIGDLYYIMDNQDGSQVYDINRNSIYSIPINEKEIIKYVQSIEKKFMSLNRK